LSVAAGVVTECGPGAVVSSVSVPLAVVESPDPISLAFHVTETLEATRTGAAGQLANEIVGAFASTRVVRLVAEDSLPTLSLIVLESM
jgi:hypothetical protein